MRNRNPLFRAYLRTPGEFYYSLYCRTCSKVVEYVALFEIHDQAARHYRRLHTDNVTYGGLIDTSKPLADSKKKKAAVDSAPVMVGVKLYTLMVRDGMHCHYCNKTLKATGLEGMSQNHPDRPTIEHVVPISISKNSAYTNLVVACRACNNKRGSLNNKHMIGDQECDFCKTARRLNTNNKEND